MLHKYRMLAALLLAPSAMAAAIDLQGHTIELQDAEGARTVVRTQGTRYAIPGTPSQIVGKAQQCLSRKDSRAGVVSVDAAGGRLAAISRVDYDDGGTMRLAKGRLTVEAGEGDFHVVLSHLGVLEGVSSDGMDEIFAPLQLREGAGGEAALAAVIAVERALVDCMFG